MKVAIVNTFDAKDITKWSGLPFYLSSIVDSIFNNKVTYVKLPKFKRKLSSYLLSFYFNRILKKKYYTWADKNFVKTNRLLGISQAMDFDLVITFDFYLVPLLKNNNNKIIHWNDATFHNIHNYYPGYSNFSKYSLEAAHLIQKQALELSDMIIYSSDWAINSAISYYGIQEQKLKKIIFPSIFKTTISKDDIKQCLELRKHDVVKLLFITADWQRKGGYDAVEVLNKLNNLGVKTLLYVVGTNVPELFSGNKNIIHYDFINKNSPEGESKLVKLFKEASFLIMPTRIDVTPAAFSEAGSFALPVITTSVGAIPSVIENNVNGHYFDIPEFIEEAVKFITNRLPSSTAYEELCYSSFDYYRIHMTREQVRLKLLDIFKELEINIE